VGEVDGGVADEDAADAGVRGLRIVGGEGYV
jgi:hypothetical protein